MSSTYRIEGMVCDRSASFLDQFTRFYCIIQVFFCVICFTEHVCPLIIYCPCFLHCLVWNPLISSVQLKSKVVFATIFVFIRAKPSKYLIYWKLIVNYFDNRLSFMKKKCQTFSIFLLLKMWGFAALCQISLGFRQLVGQTKTSSLVLGNWDGISLPISGISYRLNNESIKCENIRLNR